MQTCTQAAGESPFPLYIVQGISSGCCDFLAQCILVCILVNHCTYHLFYSPKSSKIYCCWIVWSRNIRVVIIPSFLAVAYLGRSIYRHLISRFQFIASTSYLGCATFANFGTYLAPADYNKFRRNHGREWPGNVLDCVQDPQGGKAASTSVERTLDTTGGTKLRHIIFIIIESGMTLLVIQLVRMLLYVCVQGHTISGGGGGVC